MPLVYEELRRLARDYLRRERADHTLQPTALVHEAYLRLVDDKRVTWQDRAHFYGRAALDAADSRGSRARPERAEVRRA